MKASEVVKELQNIIDTSGDHEVDISLEKQKDSEQQYLVAEPKFVVLEPYPKETRISIRDWPY